METKENNMETKENNMETKEDNGVRLLTDEEMEKVTGGQRQIGGSVRSLNSPGKAPLSFSIVPRVNTALSASPVEVQNHTTSIPINNLPMSVPCLLDGDTGGLSEPVVTKKDIFFNAPTAALPEHAPRRFLVGN